MEPTHEQIWLFIKELRESFSDSVHVFTHGSCGRLFLLLNRVWPGGIPYTNEQHIITRYGGRYYDITGEVNPTGYCFVPPEKYDYYLSPRYDAELHWLHIPDNGFEQEYNETPHVPGQPEKPLRTGKKKKRVRTYEVTLQPHTQVLKVRSTSSGEAIIKALHRIKRRNIRSLFNRKLSKATRQGSPYET